MPCIGNYTFDYYICGFFSYILLAYYSRGFFYCDDQGTYNRLQAIWYCWVRKTRLGYDLSKSLCDNLMEMKSIFFIASFYLCLYRMYR